MSTWAKSGRWRAGGPGGLDQIGFLLGRAYYSYIGLLERWLEEAGLAGRLKPGMGSLLFALFERDDRTITDIARELQLAKSTMTGMVARMRKSGLLEVEPDADDGRAVRLRLTPLARSLESRCRRMARRMEGLLCRGLTRAQQRGFRGALARVNQTIAGELGAEGSMGARSGKRGSKEREAMT